MAAGLDLHVLHEAGHKTAFVAPASACCGRCTAAGLPSTHVPCCPRMQESGASDAELAALKKRKLIAVEQWKTYTVGKGAAWAPQRKKAATELTAEMLQK